MSDLNGSSEFLQDNRDGGGQTNRVRTRSQSNLRRPKEYTDGTVRYDPRKKAFAVNFSEPKPLSEAL